MSYATAAPGQQAGTVGSAPPTCQNCQTSTTPLWRRDESGSVLCNACGLFLKLHGRSRPSSLKTDVIKSRNRVKTSSQGKQPKKSPYSGQGLAAAHPDLSSSPRLSSNPQRPSIPHTRLSDSLLSTEDSFLRPDSPSAYRSSHSEQHHSNIAPQHLFDGIIIDSPSQHHASNGFSSHSPYITHRNESPSPLSPLNANGVAAGLAGHENGSSDSRQDLRSLVHSNTSLKTRVSELEVINELFRGRVAELESSEAEAQRQLDDAQRREQNLRAKIAELQAWIATPIADDKPSPTKRARLSNGDENSYAASRNDETATNGSTG